MPVYIGYAIIRGICFIENDSSLKLSIIVMIVIDDGISLVNPS